VLVEANTIQEVSHEGDKVILQFKDSIEADRCPLGRGGVIEVTGGGIFGGSQEGVEGDLGGGAQGDEGLWEVWVFVGEKWS